MQNIKLKNNAEIPILGFGTYQLQGDKCAKAIKTALAVGYHHLDTAKRYDNEKIIGQIIKEFKREKLFITSKAWIDGINGESVLRDCHQSLEKLGTTYLNLYLLHWFFKDMPIKDILKSFKKLYDQGKIKNFGVSNCTINHLKKLIPLAKELNLPISINQVEFHPLLYQKELLDFCRKEGIVLTAYSPLARGEVLKNKILIKIGTKYNKNPCQVSLRWMIQKGIVVIPKASSEKHIESNFNIFDFELSTEDVKEINNIQERKRTINPPYAEFEI